MGPCTLLVYCDRRVLHHKKAVSGRSGAAIIPARVARYWHMQFPARKGRRPFATPLLQ